MSVCVSVLCVVVVYVTLLLCFRLCRHCLVSWLQSSGCSQATCPLCRAAILEESGGDLDSAVDQLPSDLVLQDEVDSARQLQGPHSCGTCDTPDIPALHLCLHCGDRLCDRCAQVW